MARTSLPENWQTPEVRALLVRDLNFPISGLELMVIHGEICLALKHPKNTGPSSVVAQGILLHIEQTLESLGVPEPPLGWRADVPV